MAGNARAAQMQRVEVVEAVDDAPVRAARTGGLPARSPVAGPEPGRPDHGRAWRWWAAAVAVAALVVAGLAALDALRERTAAARRAEVPGLLRPVPDAVHEVWRGPGLPNRSSVVASGDLLIVGAPDAAGYRVTALDARTGAHRWRQLVAAGSPGFEGGRFACPAPAGGDVGAILVCLLTPPTPVYASGEVVADHATVVVFDASTGERLGRHDVPGVAMGIGRVGDDVVFGAIGTDGAVVVRRLEPVSWHERWSYEQAGRLESDLQLSRASVEVSGSVVVVDGAELTVLDVDDARPLMTASRALALAVVPYRDAFATWTPALAGRLYDAAGEPTIVLPGTPARLVVDDGTLDDVVVVGTGAQVHAIDARDGATRWAAQGTLAPRGVVGARVLVGDAAGYGVMAGADGRMLWESPGGFRYRFAPLTDGAVVLGQGLDRDGRPTLEARDVRDGARYWSTPLPEDVRDLRSVGGWLVARTSSEVVVLG